MLATRPIFMAKVMRVLHLYLHILPNKHHIVGETSKFLTTDRSQSAAATKRDA